MKLRNASIIGGLVLPLMGCVSPHATKPSVAGVDFKQYRNVKLAVIDSVNTPYSKEGVPMLEGLLKGRLESMGYTLVGTNAQMSLDVTVREFSPGDRTLRTLVGFGAGRAVCKYTARFQDDSGKLLGELEGGKSYHGMEVVDNPTFKSDESTRMGLVSYPVSQIAKFIETNGAEPGK